MTSRTVSQKKYQDGHADTKDWQNSNKWRLYVTIDKYSIDLLVLYIIWWHQPHVTNAIDINGRFSI